MIEVIGERVVHYVKPEGWVPASYGEFVELQYLMGEVAARLHPRDPFADYLLQRMHQQSQAYISLYGWS